MKNVHLSLGWWVSSVAWRFCKITTTTLLLVWINKPIICDKFPPASKNSSDSYRKYLVVIILCLSWNDGSVVCHGMWTFIIQCRKRFMAFDLAAEFRKYLYFCFPWYEIWSMTINFLIKMNWSYPSHSPVILNSWILSIFNCLNLWMTDYNFNIGIIFYRLINCTLQELLIVFKRVFYETILPGKRDNISPHKNTAFKTAPKILLLTIIGNKYMYLVGICIM